MVNLSWVLMRINVAAAVPEELRTDALGIEDLGQW